MKSIWLIVTSIKKTKDKQTNKKAKKKIEKEGNCTECVEYMKLRASYSIVI
jgi:hypothetical protein